VEAGSGAAGGAEFFLAEPAVVLDCGPVAAGRPAHRAWTLRESLPGTWAAPAAGTPDEYRARVLAEVLEHTDPAPARRVEARLLPDAAADRREAQKAGHRRAAGARRRRRKEQAQRRADVRVHPCPQEGRATLPPT
jgi:hypothetical protein